MSCIAFLKSDLEPKRGLLQFLFIDYVHISTGLHWGIQTLVEVTWWMSRFSYHWRIKTESSLTCFIMLLLLHIIKSNSKLSEKMIWHISINILWNVYCIRLCNQIIYMLFCVHMQALWFLSHAPMAPTLLLMSEVYRMRESAWPAHQENFAGYLIHLAAVLICSHIKMSICAEFFFQINVMTKPLVLEVVR